MIQPAIDAVVLTMLLTFFCEFIARLRREKTDTRRKKLPVTALSFGLLVSLGIMAALGPGFYGIESPISSKVLYWVILGGVIVYTVGLKSDFSRPSTHRHLLSVATASIVVCLGGLSIPYVEFFALPSVALGTVMSLLLTIFWILLITSVIEICALLPFLAGLVAIFMGLSALVFDAGFPTYPGYVMAGTLIGAVIGRGLPELFFAIARPMEKNEVLILGYLTSVTTMAVYTKTFALTGLVFPVGAFLAIMVLLLTQSLDRSLMLREIPRK